MLSRRKILSAAAIPAGVIALPSAPAIAQAKPVTLRFQTHHAPNSLQGSALVRMAERIQKDLSSPAGGVRRYTGDRYFDGQPWPVTTDWLAIYYSRIGRHDAAARLHAVNTGYAHKTGSLQLGEQFDEAKGIWVSATPLTWSGAKYVLSALELRP